MTLPLYPSISIVGSKYRAEADEEMIYVISVSYFHCNLVNVVENHN